MTIESFSCLTNSKGKTVSVPSGILEPVMIWAAKPGLIFCLERSPAKIVVATLSVFFSIKESKLKAKPSIAELL